MKSSQDLLIEQLNSAHDRAGFHCDVESLDHYIHKQAGQDIKRRISRVFVASSLENPNDVKGYYSLSTLSIELSQLPAQLSRKLPKHPIPAALVGRLAVDKNAKGCGIGKSLLVDAIRRTLSVSEQIGIYAMVVDVINDEVKGFYEQFGFARLSDESSRLFLPLMRIYGEQEHHITIPLHKNLL